MNAPLPSLSPREVLPMSMEPPGAGAPFAASHAAPDPAAVRVPAPDAHHAPDAPRASQHTGARAPVWRRLRRQGIGPAVLLGMIVVAAFLLCALFGQLIAPFDAMAQDFGARLSEPEMGRAAHWLGTDQLGRDVASRIIVGARPTAIVALACIVFGGGLGGLLGVWAGYAGGRVDAIVMHAADATLSLPALLLALVFAVTTGPGIAPVVATISLLIWAIFARVVRSAAAGVRHRDWIRQARVNGCSDLYIMARHVLPHVVDVWLVVATLQLGNVILLDASLSFLGVGVPPPYPSWGQMTAAGREYLQEATWVAVCPALALTFVIMAFNLLGDWLRDRLDPRQRVRE